MEVTNAMILTAISDLSGFVKTLTEGMVEVKSDIAEMKQEMKQMNEKIDATHDLAIRIDDKVTILNGEFLGTRADVLALQRAK